MMRVILWKDILTINDLIKMKGGDDMNKKYEYKEGEVYNLQKVIKLYRKIIGNMHHVCVFIAAR